MALTRWNCILWVDGLVQHCSNSIANAQELLQSYTKPSIWFNVYIDDMCNLIFEGPNIANSLSSTVY